MMRFPKLLLSCNRFSIRNKMMRLVHLLWGTQLMRILAAKINSLSADASELPKITKQSDNYDLTTVLNRYPLHILPATLVVGVTGFKNAKKAHVCSRCLIKMSNNRKKCIYNRLQREWSRHTLLYM